MAIPIQCPECHKKYQAPDHMAGRRVKCKYCGVVFLIAADARSGDAGLDLSALDELNASELGKRAAPRAAGGEDIDSIFGAGEFREPGAARTNKLYVFPLSRLLDHWLPYVLLLVGLGWMIREAFERNESGRTWVAVFRAGLFLLAFFASVLPFTLMGVRAAGKKLNYEMPPNPGLRVMGAFAVPFALVCAMWLLNAAVWGSIMASLFGFAIGVAVAMPVLFLLFRLLPWEAPVTFGYAAGSFLLAVVVSAASLFALNLMLVGGLRATKTEHALTGSPFGPGFGWDGPTVLAQADDVQEPEPQPESPTTSQSQPSTVPSTRPHTTGPSTPTTRPVVVEGQPQVPTTSPSERDVVAQRPDESDPTFMPKPPRDPAATGRPTDPPANGAQVKVNGAGGIVAGIRTVVPADIGAVIYPTVPGPWVAIVRPGRAGHDHIERWSTETWQKTGEIDVPRDQGGNEYALSPDGETLAYVSDFPRHAVQLWSFKERRSMRQLPLDDGDGEAVLIGFASAEQVVVQRRKGNANGMEVWSIKGGRPKKFVLSEFDPRNTPTAISPDGQTIAFLVRGGNGADLESYSLATGRAIKQMPVVDVNWNVVTSIAGFAFTPDNARIAAVFADGHGAGVYVEWPAAGRGGRAVRQPFLPVGVNPPARPEMIGSVFEGRPMHWLDEGRAWLLWGGSVFDTESGELLAELKIADVRSQSTWGNNASLVVADPFGGHHLDEVKLDLTKARKPAARPARGTPR